MFISVANPDLEIQEAPAAHSLQLCPLIQTIILGGELAGDPQSQINFAWPFESQLSLKKRGGGGGGGISWIRHCLYLLSCFFFFTAGKIAFCHKL